MKILKATYGGVDCTQIIKNKVINNTLKIRVDNSIIGDPKVGVVKYLFIEWERDGIIENRKWKEGSFCIIEKDKLNKLGIFYSNNTTPQTQNAIIESLKSIKIASEGKAEILTCMWKEQNENPFKEYIAWTQTYSHLNQLLQIMQLLYNAKETGNYESVSFLEHDVLYPEDYFDYEIPQSKTVLCNMNYIGMKKGGFQKLKKFHRPLHQMTMRFDDAIEHFKSILPNALIRNEGYIEPKLQMVIRNTKNPSVHLNHGYHLTTHFSIYSSETEPKHSYWGDISEYKHLFPPIQFEI